MNVNVSVKGNRATTTLGVSSYPFEFFFNNMIKNKEKERENIALFVHSILHKFDTTLVTLTEEESSQKGKHGQSQPKHRLL